MNHVRLLNVVSLGKSEWEKAQQCSVSLRCVSKILEEEGRLLFSLLGWLVGYVLKEVACQRSVGGYLTILGNVGGKAGISWGLNRSDPACLAPHPQFFGPIATLPLTATICLSPSTGLKCYSVVASVQTATVRKL